MQSAWMNFNDFSSAPGHGRFPFGDGTSYIPLFDWTRAACLQRLSRRYGCCKDKTQSVNTKTEAHQWWESTNIWWLVKCFQLVFLSRRWLWVVCAIWDCESIYPSASNSNKICQKIWILFGIDKAVPGEKTLFLITVSGSDTLSRSHKGYSFTNHVYLH